MAVYAGYEIKKPRIHPWFVWIYWINPLVYSMEALMTNELHDTTIDCVGNNLVPNGPNYIGEPASCAGVSGAVQGETSLTGDQYLQSLSFNHQHMWRNMGILWAWWVLYVGITIVATTKWKTASERGGLLLIPREKLNNHKMIKYVADEESPTLELKLPHNTSLPVENQGNDKDLDRQLAQNTSIFTWRDLSYSVKTPSGERLLLDNVHGWVKPGMLGALMGASGGSTSLHWYTKLLDKKLT